MFVSRFGSSPLHFFSILNSEHRVLGLLLLQRLKTSLENMTWVVFPHETLGERFAHITYYRSDQQSKQLLGRQSSNSEFWTANFDRRISDSELRIPNFELRPLIFQLRTSNPALRTSNFDLRPSNFDLRTSNFVLRTSYIEQPTASEGEIADFRDKD